MMDGPCPVPCTNYLAPMRTVLLSFVLLFIVPLQAQLGGRQKAPTHADTLRGSIGPERAWWNVKHYDVWVKPDFATRSIQSRTKITFEALTDGRRMQIDLQQPLVVDSILAEITTIHATGGSHGVHRLAHRRDGNVLWVDLPDTMRAGSRMPIHIHYHGSPRSAKNPPWDGGWIWKTDAKGNPWMSVACQGLGASAWYPCKDHQSDEPEGARLHIVVPDSLVGVGNGRFNSTTENGDGTTTWHWHVASPINTYNLVPYIGRYVHIKDGYDGLDGQLDIDHWVLAHNEAKAREHFKQVHGMLQCFEEWLGPYPFYPDGYKLVEAPHLGMEHQGAIAYGNNYLNGYLGQDLSSTGHGLDWDYIIVHESGHEWYGNSITTADIADMWVHEGFTMYTEALYVECTKGRDAAEEYVVGIRRNILNDKPVIGPYHVNREGSGDMYPKGANLVHMVRHIMADDARFKEALREMDRRFRHSITSSGQIEAFLSEQAGRDLSKVFDQYLRTRMVPVLQWGVDRGRLWYRWQNVVEGFDMPIRLKVDDRDSGLVPCTTTWQALPQKVGRKAMVLPDRNWYVQARQASRFELRSR